MYKSDYEKWITMRERVQGMQTALVDRFPGFYLLVCVATGRFAIGDPAKDGQGGHKDASDNFDTKYGTMEVCGERWRSLFGVTLHKKT